MDTKQEQLLQVFGQPKFKLDNGQTISFARCGKEDVNYLEELSDEELLEEGFDSTVPAIQGCFSIRDLQYENLVWYEINKRKLELTMRDKYKEILSRLDALNQSCGDAQ